MGTNAQEYMKNKTDARNIHSDFINAFEAKEKTSDKF